MAAPQLTGSLLRIPFGAWVDKVGGRLPMLTLFGISIVGMWGLVFILVTVPHVTAALYPIILMFGFMSGCGVASFSVGVPQVSYWFPRNRQGTALGIYGGVGNLAPGLFTLILPFAIGALGLAGSYLAWLAFLLVGTGIYGWLARDAYYFQLRARGVDAEEARQRGAELRPGTVPARVGLGRVDHRGRRDAHLGPDLPVFRLLRRLPGADRLVPDLLDQPAPSQPDHRRASSAASASRCWRP